MIIDFSNAVDQAHPGTLCPLCDNAVEASEPARIITANGCKYIAHDACIELEMEKTDEESKAAE